MKFVIVNVGYPLHVHAAGCRDLGGRKYQGAAKDWRIEGATVDEAVKAETAELNSQFDHPYEQDELFTIYPCCRGGKS